MSRSSIRMFSLVVVACVSIAGPLSRPVEAQCCPMDHQGGHSDLQAMGHADHQALRPAGIQHETPVGAASAQSSDTEKPPHGGQLSEERPYVFEVVYQPKEIRVYAYHELPTPIAMNNVKGELTLTDAKTQKTSKVSLKHVKPPAGSSVETYLSAAVDLSKVTDGDATASFQFDDLPQTEHVKAAFKQTVALTKTATKVKVTVAKVGKADEAAIAKQDVCPVTGAKLGSMGTPIKVLVGEEPLYLCCRGCVSKVQKSPEQYLTKAKNASSSR